MARRKQKVIFYISSLPRRNVRSQYPAKIFIFRVIKNNKCDKENIIEREEKKKSKDAAICQGNNKKVFLNPLCACKSPAALNNCHYMPF